MSVYRLYFKEKKVWLIRKSRLMVANLVTLLETYYSLSYAWILELLFALILSFSFQFGYLQTENTGLMVYQLAFNTGFWYVFLRMISRYLRGKRLHRELLNIHLSLGFYLLLWMPLGFDLTDEGWRLMGAHTLWNFPEFYQNKSSVVGSDFLLGLWLKIGPTSMIWSRLSFIVVIMIIMHYSYKLLRLFYTSNVLPILLVISMLYFVTNVRYIADYNNLGILFLIAGAYHLTRSEGESRPSFHASIAGAMLSLAVLCNFSLVIFLFVFPLYNLIFKKRIAIGYFSLSFFASSTILALLLISFGVHDAYISEVSSLVANIFGSANGSAELQYHSGSYLIERYITDAKQLGILSLINMGILFAGTMLLPRIHRALSIFVFVLCYALIWAVSTAYRFEFIVSSLLLALLILSTFIQNVEQKNFRAWYWAGSFFFLTFLGSNCGVYAITFTGGTILLCPIILMTLKSRVLKWNSGSFSLRFHTIGAFLFILIFSVWSKPDMIYRDLCAKQLNAGFESASLLGVYSTSDRTKAVDKILNSTKKISTEDDKVLFVNNISTLEFLSGNSYPFPWHLSINPDKKREQLQSEFGPDLIVVNYKDPRDKNWPNSNLECTKIDRESMKFYHNFLQSSSFKQVERNDLFGIFRKSDQ